MSTNRLTVLYWVLGCVALVSLGSWIAGSRIESPAEMAARAAAPTPSPILVPVEERVLSSTVVTRGTARFGLPQPVSVAPSGLKPSAGLITTLPLRNAQFGEGDVLLTASGRPVFILAGVTPAYRDMTPGIAGDDVRQLESGLSRLGFDPGPIDGRYDEQTSRAVASWYEASGWEPFGPTPEQLATLRLLEQELGDAAKNRVAAAAAAGAAGLRVEAARATADHSARVAEADLAAKVADKPRLVARPMQAAPLAVENERKRAELAERSAEADLAASIAERSMVALDPRQPESARRAAEARLELARATAESTVLQGELAVQAAERDAQLAEVMLEQAEASVRSAQLAGRLEVQAALDAQRVAELEARLAAERAARARADVERARSKLGIQVPADEIVFVSALPIRVEEVTAVVGDAILGPLMSVTDNQLAIDSALALDVAPMVKPGMPVQIDEPSLGIKATGSVKWVADTPGTRGVDGYHFYFEVAVDETPVPLDRFSLRLTIPIESTEGEVTVVPISALSLAADGTSRVRVQNGDALEYRVVEPGLTADGFVEVRPVVGTLAAGDLVVVGYENPDTLALQ